MWRLNELNSIFTQRNFPQTRFEGFTRCGCCWQVNRVRVPVDCFGCWSLRDARVPGSSAAEIRAIHGNAPSRGNGAWRRCSRPSAPYWRRGAQHKYKLSWSSSWSCLTGRRTGSGWRPNSSSPNSRPAETQPPRTATGSTWAAWKSVTPGGQYFHYIPKIKISKIKLSKIKISKKFQK